MSEFIKFVFAHFSKLKHTGTAMRPFLKCLLLLLASAAMFFFKVDPTLAENADWPRTVTDAGGELTLHARPVRIVSTTPSVTGILLSMNAPIVASAATTTSILTDNKGFFLQWADVADARGVEVLYPHLTFDIEAIIGMNPDLVIASATGADSILAHLPELQAQGIATLVVNYSNRSWQELATEIGRATGLEREAGDAIRRFDARVAEVAGTIKPPTGPVSIVGYNIGGSYSIGKPQSPQAQLLKALGMTVAGLPDALTSQVSRSSDFDFISRENLPVAIAGHQVFLLRGTGRDVEALLADPLLANLSSVGKRQVYPLGPTSFRIDYYSGLQMIDAVAKALHTQ